MTKFKLKDGTETDGVVKSKVWVTSGFEPATIEYAELFGKWLAGHRDGGTRMEKEALTTSQIRNIYGEVVRLKMQPWGDKTKHALLLLKARLAYATEKPTLATPGSKAFRKVMEPALEAVFGRDKEEKDKFVRFADFFEAVLAYHRINDKKSDSLQPTQKHGN